jgi:hypothetical protein
MNANYIIRLLIEGSKYFFSSVMIKAAIGNQAKFAFIFVANISRV